MRELIVDKKILFCDISNIIKSITFIVFFYFVLVLSGGNVYNIWINICCFLSVFDLNGKCFYRLVGEIIY